MENIDTTNMSAIFGAWMSEFFKTDQFASFSVHQQDGLSIMLGTFLAAAKDTKHTNWTPAIVVDLVKEKICKNHLLEPEILEDFPLIMSAFFHFLEDKDYLSNGKAIGEALLAAEADIIRPEMERKIDFIEMLIKEGIEEGVDFSDTERAKEYLNQKINKEKVLHDFHKKRDAGISVDEIMASMTQEDQDIILQDMAKELPTSFDPDKARKGMKIIDKAMESGKTIEESVAALPPDLTQHVMGFMGSVTNNQKPVQPIKRALKIGRNDPCSCGSGKKYKQCCLRK